MIEVKGSNGESIFYDGTFVSKWRHDGKLEVAKNPAYTYRECQVKPRKRKGDADQEYDVILAMQSLMSLTVTETERLRLADLVERLERVRAG